MGTLLCGCRIYILFIETIRSSECIRNGALSLEEVDDIQETGETVVILATDGDKVSGNSRSNADGILNVEISFDTSRTGILSVFSTINSLEIKVFRVARSKLT